ncbi:ATP-binding cassette domain-containing protein [Asanoa sp. NPDC050611]|uniref:methionine ABC transporter ATP-binding protein n=1 Tax=Asanoa sp. NPDC050611 TaxID=3157098 RepID=UPI0033C11AC6
MSTPPIVEVSNAVVGYDDRIVLRQVSLTVTRGEVIAILGANGSGKSTLVRSILRLVPLSAGEIALFGEKRFRSWERIGYVPQRIGAGAGVPATVAEVVGSGLVARRGIFRPPGAADRAAVASALAAVGLADRAKAYPAQLSGGQKQRVGIARALAGEPKVLLSDEATSALDPETTGSILALLRDLNQRLGLTVLLITHEMDVVKRICDSVAIMSDGRITESGPVHELLAKPDSALARDIFRLGPPPAVEDATVVDVTVVGDSSVLSDVARAHDVDVRILDGAVETLPGGRAGRLRIALPGPAEANAAALRQLRASAVAVEVHP